MPRTIFVFPTSTTRRCDGIGDRLRQNQIAGAHGDRLVAAAQERASVLVDAAPRSDQRPLADDARDAIARLMQRSRAPLREHAIVIEKMRKPLVDVLDECDGGVLDAMEVARRKLADRD